MDFELETRNIEAVKNIMRNNNATYSSVKEILQIENTRLFMWYNTRINSLLLGSLDDEVINFYKYKNFTFGYNLYLWIDWCILLKDYLEKNNATLISDNECVNEYYKLGRWTKRQILNFRHLTNEQKEAFLNTKINCKWSGKTIEEVATKTNSMTQLIGFDLEARNIQSIKEIMKETNATYSSVQEILHVENTRLFMWYSARINSLLFGSLSDEVINFYKNKNFTFGCNLYLWNDWCNLLKEYLEKNHTNQIDENLCINEYYQLGRWAKTQINRFKHLTLEQKVAFVNTKIKFKWFSMNNRKIGDLNNTSLTIEEILSENPFATRCVLEEFSKGMAERDKEKITNVVIEQIEISKIKCIKKRLMKQMGSLYTEAKVERFLEFAKSKYKDLIVETGAFPKLSQLDSERIKKYVRSNLVEWKLFTTENNPKEDSLLICLYSFVLVKTNNVLDIKGITWEMQFFNDDRTYGAFYFDDDEKVFLSAKEVENLFTLYVPQYRDILYEYQSKRKIYLYKEEIIQALKYAKEKDNINNNPHLFELVSNLHFHSEFRWIRNEARELDGYINENVCLVKKLTCKYVDVDFLNCYVAYEVVDSTYRPYLLAWTYIIYDGAIYIFQEVNRVAEYYHGYRLLQSKQ